MRSKSLRLRKRGGKAGELDPKKGGKRIGEVVPSTWRPEEKVDTQRTA